MPSDLRAVTEPVFDDRRTAERSPFAVAIAMTPIETVRHMSGQFTASVENQADLQARRRVAQDMALGQRIDETLRASTVGQMLATLRQQGMAWRDIARVVGVSVPAIQKWRRGEGVTPTNRRRLAHLCAIIDAVADSGVVDPAGWLEVPIQDGLGLTPMMMLAAQRTELVLDLASAPDPSETRRVLDEFDTEWRTKFGEDGFETFIDEEGMMGIRPRS